MLEVKTKEVSETEFDNIYVVSDIHGHLKLFNNLINKLNLKGNDLLVIAGDSCDRGPNSAGVYDRILNLQKQCRVIHLLGNHEYMFFSTQVFGEDKELWLANQGLKTLHSYQSNEDLLNKHLDFIESMPTMLETEKHIIVHAGLDPDKEIAKQKVEDLLWIRDKFINRKLPLISKTIVFGHSITKNSRIYLYDNDTIGIDCGSYKYGKLGAWELKSQTEFYVK